MKSRILSEMREHREVLDKILNSESFLSEFITVCIEILQRIKRGGKILLCGNGGSASDVDHLAGELIGRYMKERDPIPAIVLHQSISGFTAIANDYDYSRVFERAVLALGRPGDVLIAISTSGSSENVIRAVHAANSLDILTVGITGARGEKLRRICRYCLTIPSGNTPRIQEIYLLLGHIMAGILEEEYGKYKSSV